ALQVGYHRVAGNVLPQPERQRRGHVRIDLRAHDLGQAHNLARGIGDLEPHQALARYGFDHADAHYRQRPRQIPHQVDDLAALDADRGLKLVARDHRARVGRDHFDLHAEIEQLLLDQPRSELERVRADHLVRSLRFVEQGQRGQQRIGQVLEQRDLLLALDARRFGYLGRRRLDADRLVDLQLLLADLDYFLALDDRLYPRAPVLPFLPAALRKEIRGLAPGTHPLDDREPRYS